MTPFEGSGPELPYPPVDIPVPDLPPANFTLIGQQFEQGRQQAAAAANTVPGWLSWIADLVAKIIGALLGLLLSAVAYVLGLIYKVWGAAEGGTDQVAAAAVSGMFGINVSPGAFQSVTNPSQRAQVGSDIATAIIGALGGSFTGSNAQPLGPSSAGADKFLTTTTHMAIEGWLQGWIFEMVSAGSVETFAELKDIMERTLGLGRLSRRVMGPPLKTLVVDPFTWLLNSTYLPTQLPEAVLVREYLRGIIDLPTLQTKLGYLGHSTANVAALINLTRQHLSVGQLENLALHGNISDADAQAALQALGYDSNTAASALFDARVTRVDGWERQIVAEAMTLYVDGKIDFGQWSQYLTNSGLPQSEQQTLSILAGLKLQGHQKLLSLGEGEQLVEQGIWGLDQLETLALQLGYSPQDYASLELLILLKMKKASDLASAKTAAANAKAAKAVAAEAKAVAKAAAAAAAAESKGVSVAEYTTLVKDGLRTIADYSAYLTGKGIAADNVAALTEVLAKSLGTTAAGAATSTAAAATVKAKNLSLAQLETAVQDNILTMDEYQQRVIAAGVSPEDATILVDLLTDKINTAKAKAQATAAKQAAAAIKHPSLAEQEKFLKLGLITADQFEADLKARGFDDADVALFMAENNAGAAAIAAGAAATPATPVTTTAKGPALADLVRGVRAGVSTIADYTAALSAAGYTPAAIALKVQLLQLLMGQDQATLAASGRASALIGQRGLSLADIERAVKLNIIPIATYTATLQKAGVSAADAATLTLVLSSGIANTGAALATRASVSAALAQVGLSLPTIEKDLLTGALTEVQLASVLSGAGVSATDQNAILGLVQAQVQNQQAVAALLASVTAAAKAKNLSLAQETAAVKAGVKTITDYQNFVAALGYSPADVATLVATESAALGLTSTPAAPPATPASSPSPAA
jgi:hypothetical protein